MTPINATKQQQAATILQRAVCVTLHSRILGNHRVVRGEQYLDAVHGTDETGVTKQVRSTKALVDSGELTACHRAIGSAKSALRRLAIQAHRVFGDGTYLVPLALVDDAEAALQSALGDLRDAADVLRTRWDAAVAKQAVALGPLFDARQYPTAAEAASVWDLDWHYVSFAAPEKLETVDTALFERARDKYEERMAAAYDEVRIVLREALLQVTQDIVARLTPGADGEIRNFRHNVLDGLAEYVETFKLRNIADDRQLEQVVGKLRKLTSGVSARDLKDDADLRQRVAGELKAATARLEVLVGRRAMAFGVDLPEAV